MSGGSETTRVPTPRQLAYAADTIKRYVAATDLTLNEAAAMLQVADDLGIAALAAEARA